MDGQIAEAAARCVGPPGWDGKTWTIIGRVPRLVSAEEVLAQNPLFVGKPVRVTGFEVWGSPYGRDYTFRLKLEVDG